MTDKHSQETKPDVQYEARIRSRLEKLRAALSENRIILPSDGSLREELAQVRLGQDGQVDLSSVSSRVRALALANEYAVDREEAKSIPLSLVQTQYFSLIEDIFGDAIEIASRFNASPENVATVLSGYPTVVESVASMIAEITTVVDQFWQDRAFILESHLEDAATLKGVFGGDIFPPSDSVTVESASLILDTIILADPIHRILSGLSRTFNPISLAFELIKHALSVWRLRPLVFAEVPTPIVVIVPSDSDATLGDWWRANVEDDAVFHINTTIGSDFGNLEEASQFLSQINDPEELERKAIRPERLLVTHGEARPLAERVASELAFRNRKFKGEWARPTLADIVIQESIGRMGQASATMMRASRYRGISLVEASTSWKYLCWKHSYDACRQRNVQCVSLDEEVARALIGNMHTEADLLAGISRDGIVALRTRGLLDPLRRELREGLEEIAGSSDDRSAKIADTVLRRFRAGLVDATERFAELRRQRKMLFGVEIPLFVMRASVAIAGLATGNYAMTALSALASLTGLPTGKSAWTKGREVAALSGKLERSPFGVLVSRGGSFNP